MNRTDRLLAIVLELQNKGRQRAEDLAATFETSKRTIYRDIQALSESGVPLLAVPGQGYQLMEGYFLPPLSFTTAEASMLLLGSDFVAQNFDAEYRMAAESASRKIETVLPPKLRQEVHELQGSIRFVSYSFGDPHILKLLRQATVERRTVAFDYYARQTRGEADATENRREADPYGLVYLNRAWYLVAYCHLRHDIRNFRLDRIENPTLLNKLFARPEGFKLTERHTEAEWVLQVEVLFDPTVARAVRESNFYFITEYQDRAEGLLVKLKARHERDVLDWLLSWGRHVRVLEPQALGLRIAQEAAAILQQYPNEF